MSLRPLKNTQIILANHPIGWVKNEDFNIIEVDIPPLRDNEVLIKHQWLSLDPYMRGRISPVKSYAQGVKPGELMVGATVGEVIETTSDRFKVGDIVTSATGWQKFGIAKATQVMKIDTSKAPASAYLGVLGMPGITAWTGLIDICQPKAGETVVVDAASGAVGSVVGQLGKLAGCRVVGIAGGPAKCDFVVRELGFDACIDHKANTFAQELTDALPHGIDCLFENVGGEIFELLLTKMNTFGRVALCGMVSEFNREAHAYKTIRSILVNRLRIQGFIVSDKLETWPTIREQLIDRVYSGKIKFKESIVDGIEQAPSAFIGMLKGENFGNQLVKIS
jgi:NADPH-dependent curcumin reductase CurA